MPIAEPPEWCRAIIFPSWANSWVSCGSAVNTATGRCYQYNHPRKPEEQTVNEPTGPDDPGAQDECATCGHARWRHKELDGVHVCTEYADCACGGHFVELSPATRMARVITAAGDLAHEFAGFRATLQTTLQSLHRLHTAMRVAGLLPEDGQAVDTEGTPGRHAAIQSLAGFTTEAERARLTEALGIPAGVLDNYGVTWAGQRITDMPSSATRVSDTCPTCWPRPCDPTRSLCRRNPDITQAMPQVDDQDQSEPPQDTGHMGTHQTIPHAPGRGPIRYDAPAPARGPRQPDADQPPQEHEHGAACVRYGCPNPTDQDATR